MSATNPPENQDSPTEAINQAAPPVEPDPAPRPSWSERAQRRLRGPRGGIIKGVLAAGVALVLLLVGAGIGAALTDDGDGPGGFMRDGHGRFDRDQHDGRSGGDRDRGERDRHGRHGESGSDQHLPGQQTPKRPNRPRGQQPTPPEQRTPTEQPTPTASPTS